VDELIRALLSDSAQIRSTRTVGVWCGRVCEEAICEFDYSLVDDTVRRAKTHQHNVKTTGSMAPDIYLQMKAEFKDWGV
jgi:hypothetical protein